MVRSAESNRNNRGNDAHGRGLAWTQRKLDRIAELLSLHWRELGFGDRTVTSFDARVDSYGVGQK